MFETKDYIKMIDEEVAEENIMPIRNVQTVVRKFPNQKEEYKLRMCVFCGSRKLFIDSSDHLIQPSMYHIHCSLCRARGPKMPTVALAVKAWNYAKRDVWMEACRGR